MKRFRQWPLRAVVWLGLALGGPWAQAQEAAAPVQRFDVLEYHVEGNTVLPSLAIERAVLPHLGPERSFADVEAAREALELAYRDAGYLSVLVDVPEQRINETGVIRLVVTEGRIERLKISGAQYTRPSLVRAGVPELAPGSVPHFPSVQRQVSGLARGEDRAVVPLFRPGTHPGTVEAELKVQESSPLHGSLELNNHHIQNTSPTRLVGTLRYDNLWQADHSLQIQFQTAPERTSETRVWVGTYLAPLADGDALAVYGLHSASDTPAVVGVTNVIGSGDVVGLRWVRNFKARQDYTHNFTFGIDYKDFGESVVSGADRLNSPISYAPLSLTYAGNFAGSRPLQFSVGANVGLRHFGGATDLEFSEKRFNASANWVALKADGAHSRPLGEWEGRARFAGQFAGAPLISNEQFAAGGAETVRGYYEGDEFGDDGVSLSLELASPALWGEREGPDGLYLLGFADWASLRTRDPLPSQRDRERVRLYSAGLGLRFRYAALISSEIDIGYPFEDTPKTDAGDPRVHARLKVEF